MLVLTGKGDKRNFRALWSGWRDFAGGVFIGAPGGCISEREKTASDVAPSRLLPAGVGAPSCLLCG